MGTTMAAKLGGVLFREGMGQGSTARKNRRSRELPGMVNF